MPPDQAKRIKKQLEKADRSKTPHVPMGVEFAAAWEKAAKGDRVLE